MSTSPAAAAACPPGALRPIRFRFAPRKALAALQMMVEQHEGIGLHAALKACYFADKDHLNRYGRPVFGATYRAMRFGPVPLEIYEMAKGEPLWLAEIDLEDMPWHLHGFRMFRNPGCNVPADMGALSQSDREAIDAGVARATLMTFDARTATTHGPDWQAARLGLMRYEDMLDETPDKSGRIDELREAAPFMRL